MKIGILGGTFNPVHLGHLIAAEECRVKLKLDKIIFIPAKIPPHKPGRGIALARDRYNMLRLALKGNPCFEVSRVELDRPGSKSYSVDTLAWLKIEFGPRTKMFFITGSDALAELHTWKDKDKIFELAQFVVVNRPGYGLGKVPKEIKVIEINPVDISATQIRRRIAQGRSARYLIPDAVRRYIEARKIYSED